MKKTLKYVAVSLLFTGFLYSCASSKQAPDSVIPETEIAEETPGLEETEEDKASEAEQTSESEQASETEQEESEENLSTEETPAEDAETETAFEELEPIEEPEIFEEELPEITEEELSSGDGDQNPELEEIQVLVVPEEIEEIPSELSETENPETEANGKTEAFETDTANSAEDSEKDDSPKDELQSTFDGIKDEVEGLEESSDQPLENEEEKTPEKEIVPSRTVTLKNGESLDVEYPGKGWVYLGCTDGSRNLTSAGRKLGEKNTKFTLIARTPGTVILHFYKEDILSGNYIDDYLEVTVKETKSKPSVHVKAPDYSEVVPKKPEKKNPEPVKKEAVKTEETEKTSAASPEQPRPVPPKEEPSYREPPKKEIVPEKPIKEVPPVPKAEPAPSNEAPALSPSEYLSKARKAFDENNFQESYNNADLFMTVSDRNRDEGLFLLGQIFEASWEKKDVKKAIDYYNQLKENYPQSRYWEDANKRVIYLQRFYINIR